MKINNVSNRRNFLKTAGSALVAASVPVAIAAQKDGARTPSGNNMKQMIIFGGVSEPLPSTGQDFQFQMVMNFETGMGHGLLFDVFTTNNSQVKIFSGRRDLNNVYIFQGTVERSLNSELVGKAVTIKVQTIDTNENCNLTVSIENTPLIGLLLPAIQKVRE